MKLFIADPDNLAYFDIDGTCEIRAFDDYPF